MKAVALKCPNCGGLLERDNKKCVYCGAEVVLSPDASFFRFRSEMACPKCGNINEKSSWICLNCNAILTKDIDMLKELQGKIKFEQERTKTNFMPSWMREKLEPDEFIYFVVKMGGDIFYAVTDKRVIKNKLGNFEEAPLSEVVSIDPPTFRPVSHSVTGWFEVNTFHGTITFDCFGVGDARLCGTLHAWVNKALTNHNLRKKDPRAILINLRLGKK